MSSRDDASSTFLSVDRLHALVESALNGTADRSEWREAGLHITVTRAGAAPASEAQSAADTITSNMFGQLHLHANGGGPPFVSLGQVVAVGQQVALVEAMKTYCPVLAQWAGRIAAILVEHGAEVSFGQPLFQLAELP